MVAFVLGDVTMQCLVCKECADDRYAIQVADEEMKTSFQDVLCRFCYNKFVESHNNTGFFKIAKMINWLRKKPYMRVV